MMKPGLYIVGTPIGNLEDITPRAVETLRNVDFILAEDTRHTRILLERYQINGKLTSCYRFNERSRVPFVLDNIRAGRAVAFVTNAGMPGIADPAALMVSACRRAGLYITVIPGVSSVTAAVALSGFGGGGFVFEGFLPRKKGARARRLARLKEINLPVVIFEAPHRCLQFLEEIEAVFQAREIFMGRELTKLNEECRWGPAVEIKRRLFEKAPGGTPRKVRGELTFVIAPLSKKELREADRCRGENDPGESTADSGSLENRGNGEK